MAQCIIKQSRLSGTPALPPSLSLAKRMVWAACLGEGGVIGNCPNHPDIPALLRIGQSLGADVAYENGTADIFGPETPMPPDEIDCESNSSASRFVTSLALMCELPHAVSNYSLPVHALEWLEPASHSMGLRLVKTADRISVSGPATNYAVELEGSAGAFWAPGLLMAAPMSSADTMFTLDDFTAWQPSVALTLSILSGLDINFALEDEARTLVIAGGQRYIGLNADVENDWRAGSYLLGALLLAGRGSLRLPRTSLQPERAFWANLEAAGLLSWNDAGDEVSVRSRAVQSAQQGRPALPLPDTLDGRAYPSLMPLMLLLATQSETPVKISPLYPLSPRTQIRLTFITDQLARLGADIQITKEAIEVKPSKLHGGEVDSGDDSRVAMTLGLAGLISNGEVRLNGAEAVSGAFLDFWSELRKLGADIKMSANEPALENIKLDESE